MIVRHIQTEYRLSQLRHHVWLLKLQAESLYASGDIEGEKFFSLLTELEKELTRLNAATPIPL